MVVVHDQVRRTGAGALRVDAEGVAGTVLFLIARHGCPCEGAVRILVAPHQCKGLHGVVVRHIVLGAGADGHIQPTVVLRHIPDTAAVDAVGVVIGGVVEQAVGIRDLGKTLFRVGGDQQGGAALAGGGIHGHVADDQLILVDAHPADAHGDALLVGCGIILHTVQTDIHRLALVGGGVHLPDAGQKADAAATHTAAEVQLAVILQCVAEQGCVTVVGAGHQQPGLAGPGVDLHQHALGSAAILLGQKESAVVKGIKGGGKHLVVVFVTQTALHQGEGVADGGVAGAHIQPVAVADRRPCVVLTPVTGVVGGILRVSHHRHRAVSQIVHDAVCGFDILFRVGDLLKGLVVLAVKESVAFVKRFQSGQFLPAIGLPDRLRAFRRHRKLHRQSGQHRCCQHAADDTFPVHIVLLIHSAISSKTGKSC